MASISPTRTGILLITAVFLVACNPAATPGADQRADPRTLAPKRITAAMMGNPSGIDVRFIGGGSGGGVPGQGQLGELVGARLTISDQVGETRSGQLVPRLSEAVPSAENGLWKVFPDGRMETTWKIRPGARWHDGTPLTSADALFTAAMEQDGDLPIAIGPVYRAIEQIEAPDPTTVTVTWKRPYIEADTLFNRLLVPKHVLEAPYLANKESLPSLPYWNREYVGAGPYRVQQWVQDSHVELQAFDGFMLGRPKIDEIVVKFLADERAFMANILANAVDVTVGKSVTHEQTVEVGRQWRDGRSFIKPSNTMKMWPQFVDPNPAIIGTSAQFRKALVHALNRQEMVDTIMSGESQVAHSELLAGEEYYPEGEARIVRYDYDPRKAAQMIEALGYARGADGTFRDSRGEALSVEVNATDEDQNTKPMFAIADYWKRVGIAAEGVVIPVQRQSDREYRATFPGFSLQGSTSGWQRVIDTTSDQARMPPRYSGRNYARYMNPEFDALIQRFTSTIPMPERVAALQQVMHHWTDQLVGIPLYYAMTSTFVSSRMRNAGFSPTWNAHEWDIV